MKKPEKVCVIGLDGALPARIQKYIAAGVLPNFEKLIEGGVLANNALVPHPTITPPNWTTISNGSWPGTHGITDFHVTEAGSSLDMSETHQGFDRTDSLVENIWEAAERAGKKSIVFNFPSSHNLKLKNGIVVGGNSNIVNDWRPRHLPGLLGAFSACADQIFSTEKIPRGGVKIEIEAAENWQSLPAAAGDDPLEAALELPWRFAAAEMAPTTWYLLIEDGGDKGYQQATLCTSKNNEDALFSIKRGEWSPKIRTTVTRRDGQEIRVHFRAKLLELSDDGESLTLYMTGMAAEEGFSDPPEIAAGLSKYAEEGDCGLRGGGLTAYSSGWIDLDTYIEICDFQNTYLAEGAEYLLTHQK
jgi:hypothetical protein